jgi:hypothetical protein
MKTCDGEERASSFLNDFHFPRFRLVNFESEPREGGLKGRASSLYLRPSYEITNIKCFGPKYL